MTLETQGAVPLEEMPAITRFSTRVPEGRTVNVILTDTCAARPSHCRIAWPVRPASAATRVRGTCRGVRAPGRNVKELPLTSG